MHDVGLARVRRPCQRVDEQLPREGPGHGVGDRTRHGPVALIRPGQGPRTERGAGRGAFGTTRENGTHDVNGVAEEYGQVVLHGREFKRPTIGCGTDLQYRVSAFVPVVVRTGHLHDRHLPHSRPPQPARRRAGRLWRARDEYASGAQAGERGVRIVEPGLQAGDGLGVRRALLGGRLGGGEGVGVEQESRVAQLADEVADGGAGALGAEFGDEFVLGRAALQEGDAALGHGVQDVGAAQDDLAAGATEVDAAGHGREVQVGAGLEPGVRHACPPR